MHIASLIIVGLALAAAATVYMLAPLLSRRDSAPSRAETELTLLKRQLAEIDRDVERGALEEVDAAAARREISRKILAADAARAEETAYRPAPEGASKRAAVTLAVAAPLGAALLYLGVGAPGLPDNPLAARDVAAEKRALLLDQATAEARYGGAARPAGAPAAEGDVAAGATLPTPAVGGPRADDARFNQLATQMRALLAQRPNAAEGRLVLAQSFRARGRHAEAWPLVKEAIDILGDKAQSELWLYMGEAMTLAAGGYVSREAAEAFSRAPTAGVARYYLGLAALQRGEREAALNAWSELLVLARRAPQRNAQFEATLREQIVAVAREAKLDPDAVMASIDRRAPPTPIAAAPDAGAETGSGEAAGAEAEPEAKPETKPEAEAEPGSEAAPDAAAAASPEKPAAEPPGPSAADVAAASEMSAEDRAAMIRGMVAGLAAKLKEEPKNLDGWLRLIRSYAVLGDTAAAKQALADARAAFDGETAALQSLAGAAATHRLE